MTSFVYLWNLSPEAGLSLELRVVAERASIARREVRRFLSEHDGRNWRVESIRREPAIWGYSVFAQPGPSEIETGHLD